MLAKLFSIFKSQKNAETAPQPAYTSKLEFGINKDGTIDITCYWPEFNENNAKSLMNIAYFYALAIHAINNGLLHKEIVDTMRENAKLNEYDTLFVHNVLYKLYELEKSQQYEQNIVLRNEPLVPPLDVFKHMH